MHIQCGIFPLSYKLLLLWCFCAVALRVGTDPTYRNNKDTVPTYTVCQGRLLIRAPKGESSKSLRLARVWISNRDRRMSPQKNIWSSQLVSQEMNCLFIVCTEMYVCVTARFLFLFQHSPIALDLSQKYTRGSSKLQNLQFLISKSSEGGFFKEITSHFTS